MNKELILASASPRRKQLLTQLGLNFIVEPSCEEEKLVENNVIPSEKAVLLAKQKAFSVSRRHKDVLVIGADTIVVLDDKILGKPEDETDAKNMLSALSGRWHCVYTGVTVVDADTNHYISGYEESRVKFKNLNQQEIENYIKTGEPMDKAGSYGIQGKGAIFIEKIEGCYYNIVGLPLFKLSEMLTVFGYKIL